METPDQLEAGQDLRTPCRVGTKFNLADGGIDAEAAYTQDVRAGDLTLSDDATNQRQRQREQGENQRQTPALLKTPELHLLRQLTSTLQLTNDRSWCFANVTVHSLLWGLLSLNVPDLTAWGKHFDLLIQTIFNSRNAPVHLASINWFKEVLDKWGRPQAQEDCGEFIHIMLQWLDSPVIDMHWERRVDQNAAVSCHDHGDKHMPLFVQFTSEIAQFSTCKLEQLVMTWHQAYGMKTALTRAAPLLCLHIDRLYEVAPGQIEKSSCAIEMESEVTLPIFCADDLQCDNVSYVLLAAASHLGQDAAGHYQAILKIQPMVSSSDRPIKWLLTQDNQRPCPLWHVPDAFAQNMTIAWLIRSDCFQLPQFLPAPEPNMADTTQVLLNLLSSDATDSIQAPPNAETWQVLRLLFLRRFFPWMWCHWLAQIEKWNMDTWEA